MMQHLMPKYFGDAIEERKLDIIQATPRFESVDYVVGKAAQFKAVFEVYPQLSVSNYEGIPVDRSVRPVSMTARSKLR